jgi:hypothetical protein
MLSGQRPKPNTLQAVRTPVAMLPPMTAASTARMLWLGTAVLLWSASTQVIDAADAAAPTFESMARACRATGRKWCEPAGGGTGE